MKREKSSSDRKCPKKLMPKSVKNAWQEENEHTTLFFFKFFYIFLGGGDGQRQQRNGESWEAGLSVYWQSCLFAPGKNKPRIYRHIFPLAFLYLQRWKAWSVAKSHYPLTSVRQHISLIESENVVCFMRTEGKGDVYCYTLPLLISTYIYLNIKMRYLVF